MKFRWRWKCSWRSDDNNDR